MPLKERNVARAPLVVVVQNDQEIAGLWLNLIAIAQADQEIVLFLHSECGHGRALSVDWVSDGTSFEGIEGIARHGRKFTVDAVIRACAALSPKSSRLSVFVTHGKLSRVIEKQLGASPDQAIVIMTHDLLRRIASDAFAGAVDG